MRASASALSLPLFAAALLTATAYAPRVDACGELPPLYVTVDRIHPTAGSTDIATNGALVVDTTGWYQNDAYATTVELPKVLSVELTARGTQARVPGTIGLWTPGRAIFQPTSPLAPATTYDAVAIVTNTAPKPEGNAGITQVATSFTTGSAPLAPLEFGGLPTVTFEDLDHEVCDQSTVNDCTGACGKTLPRRDRFAVIRLPAPIGGDAVGGFAYTSTVSFVDGDRPGSLGVGAERLVGIREPSRLEVPLFASAAKVGVCIEITVRDVANQPVGRGRRCYAKEEVWAASTNGSAAGAGGTGGSSGGAAGTSALEESGPPAQDPGCAVAPRTESEATSVFVGGGAALGLALVWLRRRMSREPKRA